MHRVSFRALKQIRPFSSRTWKTSGRSDKNPILCIIYHRYRNYHTSSKSSLLPGVIPYSLTAQQLLITSNLPPQKKKSSKPSPSPLPLPLLRQTDGIHSVALPHNPPCSSVIVIIPRLIQLARMVHVVQPRVEVADLRRLSDWQFGVGADIDFGCVVVGAHVLLAVRC